MKLGRNLEYSPETAVANLGPAALDDLLERGDLDDWAPLAAALKADPHGPLANMVLHLIDANPKFGTSPLWRHLIGRFRDGGNRGAPQDKTKVGVGLGALRRSKMLSQQELGRRLGITQSDVSKLERRRDLRLSTLEAYVEATGGRLEVTAVYDGTKTSVETRLIQVR